MLEAPVEVRHSVPHVVRFLDIGAKILLILMLATALAFPEVGNLEGKGALARAVAYPLLAFAIPVVWHVTWRERASFPWLADFFVTITCFTDILGNRMDLYDTIWWFDDVMHFTNAGLLAAAVILLTLPRTATFAETIERALAFGATAAIVWEVAEFAAFLSKSSEREFAYADTLSDLTLNVLGSLVAAIVIHRAWQRGRLTTTAPQLEHIIGTRGDVPREMSL